MAGDIAHNDTKGTVRIFASPEKIEVVPADFITGNIFPRDVKSLNMRLALGKQTFLNVGYLKIAYGKGALLIFKNISQIIQKKLLSFQHWFGWLMSIKLC